MTMDTSHDVTGDAVPDRAADSAPLRPIRRRRTMGRRASSSIGRFLKESRAGAAGVVILLGYVLVAIFAPALATHDPTEVFATSLFEPPGSMFLFGTDGNGMDVFSRTLFATRIDLSIGASAVLISLVAGTVLGLIAGYQGGWLDLLLLRTMDVLQAFPVLILAIAVVAAASQSIATVIFVIAFVDAPIYTRLIRAETMHIKQSTYIESARSVGNPTWRILVKHVLPNALPPILVQSAIRVSWAIKITASLAFVGVGIQVPTPEWGAMIRAGAGQVASGQWWASVFPGIALLILALGFNLLADGLQEHLGRRNG